MGKNLLFKKTILPIVLFVVATLSSCAWLQNSEAMAKRKEMLEQKRARFHALRESLAQRRLKKGTSPEFIRENFGEPDDMFQSSSSVSTFEKWTYERVVSPDSPEEGIPIQLYFNNNKLVSWSF